MSFDEWYVTQKIGTFKDLWADYYEYAYLRSTDQKKYAYFTVVSLKRSRV